jgi:hypothetical protein
MVGHRWLLGSDQLDFAIYRQMAPGDGFAEFAPVWWIDLIERPDRHRSDARPHRSTCESPHLPPAAR